VQQLTYWLVLGANQQTALKFHGIYLYIQLWWLQLSVHFMRT